MSTTWAHPRSSWPFLAFAACALLFVTKPFHLDDPMYLWAAMHIQQDPLDFYGFTVNWGGTEQPMPANMMNPPLASYWLALGGAISGWSEASMHVWMLVPALLALGGVARLAGDLGAPGGLAALIMASSPGFFVSATTIMCDVPLLAAWIWSVSSWIRGMRARRHGLLALGAGLAAVAALTKYFGLALIPLLLAYSLFRERRLGSWAAWLLVPLLAAGGYELYSAHLYGSGLVGGAARYALGDENQQRGQLTRLVSTLAFAGGCFIHVALLAPRIWSRRIAVAAAAGAVGVLVILLAVGSVGSYPLVSGRGVRWGLAAQLAAFVVAGLGLVALAVGDHLKERSAETWLVLLWTLGTLAFAGWVNWSTNARAVLPLAPVAALLLARRVAPRDGPAPRGARGWWPYAVAGALSLSLALADQVLARSGRDAAVQLASELRGSARTVWFQGHWGFQHYAQQLGLLPLDYQRSVLQPGDLMVVPAVSSKQVPMPAEAIEIVEKRSWPTLPGLATWDHFLGAAFYSDLWGPVPYAVGVTHPEHYAIVRVVGRIAPAAPASGVRGSRAPRAAGRSRRGPSRPPRPRRSARG